MRVKGVTTSCVSHSSTAICSSSNPAGGPPTGRHITDQRGAVETPATPRASTGLNRMKTSHHDQKARTSGRCLVSRAGVDYFSPHRSSRYLLEDNNEPGSGSADGLSDPEPGLKVRVPPASDQAPKAKSDHQVVVLRVSLHCRGCEGKVRKHISRMQGVTSFSIDFFAKKVTIVGNVTPLEVLAAVSKAKKAQLWPPLSTPVDSFTRVLSSETTY